MRRIEDDLDVAGQVESVVQIPLPVRRYVPIETKGPTSQTDDHVKARLDDAVVLRKLNERRASLDASVVRAEDAVPVRIGRRVVDAEPQKVGA